MFSVTSPPDWWDFVNVRSEIHLFLGRLSICHMAGRLAYDAINIDACMFDFQPNNDARTSVACID